MLSNGRVDEHEEQSDDASILGNTVIDNGERAASMTQRKLFGTKTMMIDSKRAKQRGISAGTFGAVINWLNVCGYVETQKEREESDPSKIC